MSGRAKKQTRQFLSESTKLLTMGTGVSHLKPGDLVEVHMVHLLPDNARYSSPIWMRIERCDHQRRIAIGTIESESPGLDKALTSGARLAISYDLVRHRDCVRGSE